MRHILSGLFLSVDKRDALKIVVLMLIPGGDGYRRVVTVRLGKEYSDLGVVCFWVEMQRENLISLANSIKARCWCSYELTAVGRLQSFLLLSMFSARIKNNALIRAEGSRLFVRLKVVRCWLC